jgi:PAS domain-containing protein
MEKADGGLLIHDAHGHVIDGHVVAAQLQGVTHGSLIGRGCTEPEWHWTDIHGQPVPDARHPVRQTPAHREPCHGVALGLRHPGAERRWQLISTRLLPDEGHRRWVRGRGRLTNTVPLLRGDREYAYE